MAYQDAAFFKYTLDFCGLNVGKFEDRRNPTALDTAFKFSAMTSQALNPTENSPWKML